MSTTASRSASASAAVATSVGAVLRNSKFARFDRRLPQVYTHLNGNWGAVKAPLPAPGKLPATYLTFRALDTAFRVPDMRVADHKVSAVRRLVEQIPYVVREKEGGFARGPRDEAAKKLSDGSTPVNLAEMSKKEFRTWLQTVDLSKVTASERESFRAALRACVDPKANNLNVAMDTKVSGPVYTEWESDNGMKHYVHGRVLRQYQSVQSVGVSGFVLSAETGANAKKDAQSRALAQFQVDQLYWDRRGRAHGTLTEVTRFTQEQRRHKDAVEKNVRPVSPKDRFRIQELMANARKSV